MHVEMKQCRKHGQQFQWNMRLNFSLLLLLWRSIVHRQIPAEQITRLPMPKDDVRCAKITVAATMRSGLFYGGRNPASINTNVTHTLVHLQLSPLPSIHFGAMPRFGRLGWHCFELGFCGLDFVTDSANCWKLQLGSEVSSWSLIRRYSLEDQLWAKMYHATHLH